MSPGNTTPRAETTQPDRCSRMPDSFGCLWRPSSRVWGEVCSPDSAYVIYSVGIALALISLALVFVADLLWEQRHELPLCCVQSRLGLLESLAALPVQLGPRFVSALELIDLCHPLHRLGFFRGWIFLLPVLPLFANATYVFLRLVKLVYGRPNLLVSLLGFVIHRSSPGH